MHPFRTSLSFAWGHWTGSAWRFIRLFGAATTQISTYPLRYREPRGLSKYLRKRFQSYYWSDFRLWAQDHAKAELQDFASRIRAQRLSDPTLGTFILLDRTRFDLTDSVTVLGCTLWSAIPPALFETVARSLRDFTRVQNWTVKDYTNSHARDLEWLTNECAAIRAQEPHRRVIVLSHHAPTRHGTSAPQHANSPLTSAFATELTTHTVWASPITVWAFGHTHHNSDQVLKGIRVVSNQRGYDGTEAISSGFSKDFTVRV